jgi:hypothetical protein
MGKIIFIGNRETPGGLNFIIERLPSPEQHGDWHDKPLKWISKCVAPGKEVLLTQKFSTRAEAEKWARLVRKHEGDFQAASRAYCNL